MGEELATGLQRIDPAGAHPLPCSYLRFHVLTLLRLPRLCKLLDLFLHSTPHKCR